MHGPALAIILCLALPQVLADEATAHRRAPAAQGLMHAALVAPAQAAQPTPGNRQPLLKANLPAATAAAQAADADRPPEPEGRSVMVMLLAALALMTGIVLRRWGAGQQ